MRIVDRQTFLALPPYTVYAKWGNAGGYPKEQDLTYGEVTVKGETSAGVDWYEIPLFAWPETVSSSEQWSDDMHAAILGKPTAPLRIGEEEGRDGLFDDEQLFAVFNRVEVERLAALFARCVEAAQP